PTPEMTGPVTRLRPTAGLSLRATHRLRATRLRPRGASHRATQRLRAIRLPRRVANHRATRRLRAPILDRHHMVHPHRIAGQAIEAVIMTRNRLPAPNTTRRQPRVLLLPAGQKMRNKKGDRNRDRPFTCLLVRNDYQTPLSLPVILNAT